MRWKSAAESWTTAATVRASCRTGSAQASSPPTRTWPVRGGQDTVDGALEAGLAAVDVAAWCAGRRLSLARRFRRSVEVLVQKGVDELYSEGVCVLRGVGGRLAEPQDRLRVAFGLIEPPA